MILFRRLRNRFLLMNMVIITIIMLVAFASIYTITYQNVRNDINMELHRVSDFFHKADGGGKGGGGGGGSGLGGGGGQPQPGGDKPGQQGGSDGSEPMLERSVSFALQTDAKWGITSTNSRFDMDSSFYESIVKKAAAHPTNNGRFTLDGTRWAYSVQANPAGYSIAFLDVTAQQKIITNLVYTFSVVALVMLAVIYMVSRYFASRSIEPVKEAFERQKQFIADASHELKTPLAVINTNADVLLANREETIREQEKWLHHIKSETERMKALTNDLLYLTEMDDARVPMIYVPYDVSEAVEGVLLTMEAVIFERNLELSYDIEPGLTTVGNSEQMKQVVMILLDNAIKHTPPKGLIELAVKKQHNLIGVSVTNAGEGIPSEHLDRIFDRFYRIDSARSRKQGGYGLGLAIAKSIVEQHRGKISARSVPGEKTTFTVQLNLSS